MYQQDYKTQSHNKSMEFGPSSLSSWFYSEKDYLSFVSNSGGNCTGSLQGWGGGRWEGERVGKEKHFKLECVTEQI